MPSHALDSQALDTLFLSARTQNGWLDEAIQDAQLQSLYDLCKLGPTASNCSPARLVFVRTPEGKERLAPALKPNNCKALAAPVVVIVAYDTLFHEHLPTLFPAYAARPQFTANAVASHAAALRNGSLQGAYLMLAARALGMDCGPMSGFDAEAVDLAFFPEGRCKTNFLCALGHGDPAKLCPRGPRLPFEVACRFA